MADTKKPVDKLMDAIKKHHPSRQDSGFGMDNLSDRAGKGSDNGDAPTLESKPSDPMRKVKPKSSN